MTALPTNGTKRIEVGYSVQGKKHSILLRAVEGAPAQAIVDDFRALLVDHSTIQTNDCVWDTAKVYDLGVDFSRELSFASLTMDGGAEEVAYLQPRFLSFVGRTTMGRRVRVYFYGSAGVNSNIADYRLQTGEVARWDAFQYAFKDFYATHGLVGIDLHTVTWKNYINVGYNSYWQRKARG